MEWVNNVSFFAEHQWTATSVLKINLCYWTAWQNCVYNRERRFDYETYKTEIFS